MEKESTNWLAANLQLPRAREEKSQSNHPEKENTISRDNSMLMAVVSNSNSHPSIHQTVWGKQLDLFEDYQLARKANHEKRNH